MLRTDGAVGAAPSISVEVSHLTVAYRGGNVAVSDVSFALTRPTICGLVGMNGSGKSTLFKAIMGFVDPLRGAVTVCGKPVAWAQQENLIAYVPQTEEVDWTFPVSVRDVVTMGRQGRMGFLRIATAEDRRIVADSLARVGMSEFAERQIGELSGGQRKRVFLARALAQQARIVLLDEPFTGIDLQTEQAIVTILRELKAAGHIVLVSTHDLASVPAFCDQVVMVNRVLVAFGPVETTFTQQNLDRAFAGTIRGLPSGTVQTGRGPLVAPALAAGAPA